MRKELSRSVIALMCCLTIGCTVAGQQPKRQQKVNPEARLLQDFQDRVAKYVELHKRLEKESPPLWEAKDAAKIQASRDMLAQKVRAARRNAQPGDIFTPQIRPLFRRLLYPELKGPEGADTKDSIRDDAPDRGSVSFTVNAKYPQTQPLPSMPPNLLAVLPKLPEELEYRIVGTHLLLLDVHTDLIVDFMTNIIRP